MWWVEYKMLSIKVHMERRGSWFKMGQIMSFCGKLAIEGGYFSLLWAAQSYVRRTVDFPNLYKPALAWIPLQVTVVSRKTVKIVCSSFLIFHFIFFFFFFKRMEISALTG